MERGRRTMTTGAALVVLLATGGCALDSTAPPRPVAEVVEGAPDCALSTDAWIVPGPGDAPSAPPPPLAGSVPDGFTPVSAVRCAWSTDSVDDAEGRWSARRETTWTEGLDRVLAALAVPDETGGSGMCTADMEIVPDLWLTSADGRSMRAAWPVTPCGKTLPGTHDVLEALPVEDERLVRVTHVQSRAALDAGCSMQASLPWMLGGSGIVTELPGPDDLDRACVYAVDPPLPDPTAPADSPFGAGDGSGSAAAPGTISKSVTSGTSTRVVPLAEGVGARLVLAAGQPSTPGLEQCEVTATSFVTFPEHVPGASLPADPRLTAELDGCGRLLTSDGGARPFPEEIAAALRG
ncbi:hypothetical protein [Frigoribacterium sp. PvP032]|uniref:hypothetical protein n=1 Tax=Frigoribacterium sp. PvP032 TaxID=2806589 RepID=UPI001AEA4044|nr:hypothetical protein [Frigoribacterium sp. PvP032]MBP1191405.1 hypothetical protein [Frigoribacterium sp. PvP032]